MVDIILHVGRPKTGTTAIQNFLAKNRSKLVEQGILYPQTGRFSEKSNSHIPFFLSMCARLDLIQTPIVEPPLSAHVYKRLLEAEIDAYNAHTVILSCEYAFTPAFDKTSLQRIENVLSFANINIFAILRDQATLLESSFAQRVSGPQKFTGSPNEHFDMLKKNAIFDYEQRLSDFETVFGSGRIQVAWYEDVRGDILKPLCDISGIDRHQEYHKLSYDNEKSSWLYIYLLRQVNRSRLSKTRRSCLIRLVRRVDKLLGRVGLQSYFNKRYAPFSENLKQQLRAQYLEPNKRVAQRYGCRGRA